MFHSALAYVFILSGKTWNFFESDFMEWKEAVWKMLSNKTANNTAGYVP